MWDIKHYTDHCEHSGKKEYGIKLYLDKFSSKYDVGKALEHLSKEKKIAAICLRIPELTHQEYYKLIN